LQPICQVLPFPAPRPFLHASRGIWLLLQQTLLTASLDLQAKNIGRRISTFWDGDGEWFTGQVRHPD
jgi:hypothetical protein